MELKLRHVAINTGEDISATLNYSIISNLIKKLEEMEVYSISERISEDGAVIDRPNEAISIGDISADALNPDSTYRPNSNNVRKTQAALRLLQN